MFIYHSSPYLVRTLLQHGANINMRNPITGASPLMAEFESGGMNFTKKDRDAIRLLLIYGADDTIKDNQGRTLYDLPIENQAKKIIFVNLLNIETIYLMQ